MCESVCIMIVLQDITDEPCHLSHSFFPSSLGGSSFQNAPILESFLLVAAISVVWRSAISSHSGSSNSTSSSACSSLPRMSAADSVLNFGLLTVRINTKVCPAQRSANRQNCCSLEFHANNRFRSHHHLLIVLHRLLKWYANRWTSTFATLVSQNNCRDDGWTGPDTCIRTSRGNTWFTTGVMQSFASPSKPPWTQPQLPQTFAVGVCPKLILLQVLVSCATNLPRYAMFSMTA